MITLTKEQQERLVRKRETRINWLAGIILLLFILAAVIGLATVKNPGALAAWIVFDVVVFVAAFTIRWAIMHLWRAWRKKPVVIPWEEPAPSHQIHDWAMQGAKRCGAYAEYGIACELPEGHEGTHYSSNFSPVEPAPQNK